MWLPAPIYRRAPFYWMLIGVLLTIVGTVGIQQIDFLAGLACLASGIASCFWSLHIALDRRSRKGPEGGFWPLKKVPRVRSLGASED